MRIEYERACREAGLPEEKIKEIRRMFDADYKRLKRRNEAMERKGLDFLSLELLMSPENDGNSFDFIDPDSDVESTVFHKLDLKKLHRVLGMIPFRDREFILDCFNADWGDRKWIAEKYDMTLGAIKQKKRRLLEKIRTMFFETEEM